jgi:hypothetical protein
MYSVAVMSDSWLCYWVSGFIALASIRCQSPKHLVPKPSLSRLISFQSDAVLGIAAPSEELVQTSESDVSLDLVAQELESPMVESLDTPAVPAINQLSEEFTEAEVTTFPENLIVQELLLSEEESTTTPVEPLKDRNVVVPMTPPPISTPRSLRRWLPRADQSFPQAS